MKAYFSAQAREFNKSLKQFHSNLETLKTNLQAATEKSDKRKFRRLIEKETEMLATFRTETAKERTPLFLTFEVREDIINDLIGFIDTFNQDQDKFAEEIKQNPEYAIHWHAEGLISSQETAKLAKLLIDHSFHEAFTIEAVLENLHRDLEGMEKEILTRATFDLSNSTNPMSNLIEQIQLQAKAKFINKVRNLFSLSYAESLFKQHQIVDNIPEGYEIDSD